MKKIAILAAMSKEIEQISNMLEDSREIWQNRMRIREGKIADKQVILTECGIGKVAAATNAIEIIQNFHPEIIINTGVAGSLAQNVEVKDMVVGTNFAYHDVWCLTPNLYGQVQGFPASFDADKKVVSVLKKNFGDDEHIHFGQICSGDRFVCYPEDVQTVLQHFPDVKAVDMEAAAIAQICYMYKCKFLSLKVISDNPAIHPNGIAQYDGFWHDLADISFGKIAQVIKII